MFRFAPKSGQSPARLECLLFAHYQTLNVHSPQVNKAPTFSTTETGTFKRAIDMSDDELAAIVAKARQGSFGQGNQGIVTTGGRSAGAETEPSIRRQACHRHDRR